MDATYTTPSAIEAESMRIIGEELARRGIALPPEHEAVVKRVIHTTADFDYVGSLRFTDGGAEAAVAALRGGCSIVTDTNMAKAGISKAALSKLGGEAVCFMADPETVRQARERGVTRAAVCMGRAAAEQLLALLEGGTAQSKYLDWELVERASSQIHRA